MYINIGKTRISISFWFAVVLCTLMLMDKSGAASSAFLSALLHETGHIVAFALQKRAPAQIAFTPFGLRLTEGNCPGSGAREIVSYAKEIQAAFAGPLVNLCLCIFAPRSQPLFFINVALFTFNMLPVHELDGGRILRAYLSLKKCPAFAGRTLMCTSFICVFLAFAVFFIGAIYGKYNFSLFLATFYLGALTLTSETTGLLYRKGK